jgi:hypothetical protein
MAAEKKSLRERVGTEAPATAVAADPGSFGKLSTLTIFSSVPTRQTADETNMGWVFPGAGSKPNSSKKINGGIT